MKQFLLFTIYQVAFLLLALILGISLHLINQLSPSLMIILIYCLLGIGMMLWTFALAEAIKPKPQKLKILLCGVAIIIIAITCIKLLML